MLNLSLVGETFDLSKTFKMQFSYSSIPTHFLLNAIFHVETFKNRKE